MVHDKFQSLDHRELDSAVQFQLNPVSRYSWCLLSLYMAQNYLYLSTGLCQPRECMKFSHCYLSEMQLIMYLILDILVLTNFQVSERLHQDPEFLHAYLIGYIIISSPNNRKKVNCY